MRRTYAQAEAIVAVSNGVADDLARLTGLPRERVRTVYNPVVGPELARLAAEPVDHPWFSPVGRRSCSAPAGSRARRTSRRWCAPSRGCAPRCRRGS
jgi:hypothetical protein